MSQPPADTQTNLWRGAAPMPFEEMFVGPLGWSEGAVHTSRHPSYAQERSMMCWDSRSSCVVLVVDFQKVEYWGERVLVVKELAPNGLGISWQRRQGELWELGEPFQSGMAVKDLRDLAPSEREALAERLKHWFGARMLAQELSESSNPASAAGGKASRL